MNTGEKELDACVQQVVDEMLQRSIIGTSKLTPAPERWLKQLKTNGKIEYRGAAKTGGYYYLDADQ